MLNRKMKVDPQDLPAPPIAMVPAPESGACGLAVGV